MADYVLIHGAGSTSWYWHLVRPRLQAMGHTVIAPDLPCDDDRAGMAEYVETVIAAAENRTGAIVVGQSMGGFTAPLVSERIGASMVILTAAMTPLAGESPGEWWEATGHGAAMQEQASWDGRVLGEEFDPVSMFLHDVPAEVIAESVHHLRDQSGTPFSVPFPMPAWPDVPTRFLLCTNDRFFPAQFQRRLVRDRLGITPDELASGHLPALGHPDELAAYLDTCQRER